MAERRRLSPGTHLIHGIRARTNSLDECIEEFVDNSLEHGEAKNITIVIANNGGIVIQDDGIGVSDINRVFEIASSSAYDDKSKLSQYGVGAKDSAIWLGDELTIKTVHEGRYHTRTVNWNSVIKNGWPFVYDNPGRPAGDRPQGTTLIIKELRHNFYLKSSEKLARKLGSTFSSAIRDGVKMTVLHELAGGQRQIIRVEPFVPPGLADRMEISGSINTGKGELRWTGVAGLAQGLTHDTNGVHIYFRHRRIETNRLPFCGMSAPTLYCEVYLDAESGWKRSLSDHKKKVVAHREPLMQSIHEQIEPLLQKASEQSLSIALSKITLPIEAELSEALRGDGDLFIDPDGDGEYSNEGQAGPGPGPRDRPVRDPLPEGLPAKPGKKPTGVKINWRNKDYLDGALWNWEVTGKQLIIEMDRDHYRSVSNLDSDLAQGRVRESAVLILSHAVEHEFLRDPESLAGVVAPIVRKKIGEWGSSGRIAPKLNRILLQKGRES
ncbi:hypothetical protein SEA_BOBBY_96 [Mycobacterium phage Bobby]|nr:hypothetical protein SEA_BOBBY_96 [Mycobacterium phage Bobby]